MPVSKTSGDLAFFSRESQSKAGEHESHEIPLRRQPAGTADDQTASLAADKTIHRVMVESSWRQRLEDVV